MTHQFLYIAVLFGLVVISSSQRLSADVRIIWKIFFNLNVFGIGPGSHRESKLISIFFLRTPLKHRIFFEKAYNK
jgi:hypothetical protein